MKQEYLERLHNLQSHWIGRTLAERKRELSLAESNDDFEQCIEIKESLDKGAMMIDMLHIEQRYIDNPYQFPALIWKIFNLYNDVTGELQSEKVQDDEKGIVCLTFAFRGHVYNTLRIAKTEDNELHPKFMIENPTHPNCGSETNKYIYIIEKVCGCPSQPSSLQDIIDEAILTILATIETNIEHESNF